MKAVLYICHGSRLQAARDEAISFVSSCMKEVCAKVQEVCFLELTTPSIPEGFASCIQKGATEIIVVPVFLLAAVHVKEDIPAELEEMKRKYPNVSIIYGSPFGVSKSLVSAVMRGSGVKELGTRVTLLFVARGSSDRETLASIEEIASLIGEEREVDKVEVCYLAAATPQFEEKLQSILQEEHEQIAVLPYLLFTGLLMKRIEREIRKVKTKTIHLCPYLGENRVFQERLIQHTNEMLRGDEYVSTYGTARR